MVNSEETEKDYKLGDVIPPRLLWKARVHEIRAIDVNHVYLLASWLYRPEDLPEDLQSSYHGTDELIVSNELTIIDARSLTGVAEVKYWDENDDEHAIPSGDDVWICRQSYDVTKGILSVSRATLRLT